MTIDRKTAGKPQMLGKINKKLILDSLRKEGPQSRVELSKRLGLSFPAVSANIDELLANDLIKTGDSTVGKPGRRATLFSYNAEWCYVLSIDLGRSHIRMMLSDATGNVLKVAYFKLLSHSEKDAVREIDDHFQTILQECGVDVSKVKGISVGIPGVVDNGKIRMAPYLNEALRNYQFDTFFKEKYNIRVYTENSVNLSAVAEKWQGAGMDYSNIVYVDCAVGLGCALILNGELVSGTNGATGEIGYMLPNIHYRRTSFDESGILERVLCADGYDNYMRIAQMQETGNDMTDLQRQYLEDTKDYLALTLINLTAVINPEIVIVGGRLGLQFMERYEDYYREMLRAHVPYTPLLVKSKLGENAALIGASAYVLRRIHEMQADVESDGLRIKC